VRLKGSRIIIIKEGMKEIVDSWIRLEDGIRSNFTTCSINQKNNKQMKCCGTGNNLMNKIIIIIIFIIITIISLISYYFRDKKKNVISICFYDMEVCNKHKD